MVRSVCVLNPWSVSHPLTILSCRVSDCSVSLFIACLVLAIELVFKDLSYSLKVVAAFKSIDQHLNKGHSFILCLALLWSILEQDSSHCCHDFGDFTVVLSVSI